MPRRVYTYPAGLGFEIYNQVETAGALLLGVAFLVFIWNVVRTTRGPADAPADPWNGATLEWAIPSPPQEFNFPEIPVVHSRDPLWETKRERGGQLPEPARVSGAGIHMPHPSYWPAVAAIGVASVFISLMMLPKLGPAGVVVAVLILFLGVYKWAFEPA
jgi:cytochrome c oxidase subunit 1